MQNYLLALFILPYFIKANLCVTAHFMPIAFLLSPEYLRFSKMSLSISLRDKKLYFHLKIRLTSENISEVASVADEHLTVPNLY